MISAQDLRTAQVSGTDIAILDIRSAADFANGHIEGAVNVAVGDIVTYYRNNNLSSKNRVIIACYSGQSAGFATALLRLSGYSNVYDFKFGMSVWNEECANS